MNVLTQIVGALVEAWGEVRVQKARVVLSLVGVVAAVAAMSTVIAMGDLIVQSNQEMQDAYSGRAVTLTLSATQQSSDGSSEGAGGGGVVFSSDGAAQQIAVPRTGEDTGDGSDPDAQDTGWSPEATGVVNDPLGGAMVTVADRFQIPYWSRLESGSLRIREVEELSTSGTFRGVPMAPPQNGYSSPQVLAVDPDYQVIYRLELAAGRWLSSGDVNQRATPVVINSVMWEYFGSPDIRQPLVLQTLGDTHEQLRVVGVVQATSEWDQPTVYMPYDSWKLMQPADPSQAAPTGNAQMIVWAGEDQADQARQVLPSALGAVLGEGWSVDVYGGEQWDAGQDEMATIRLIVMVIGAIVITLGALGLLNVSIVTVRQRIREIGIRRAVGASARRVFFSVFMESVVATFAAGVIGVGLAILVLRVLPMESMGIYLQDQPPFPMSAAVAGVGIASAVGALCGIIPAFAAVRVRPIDAIRY
ncbi:MAG: ABC transporter permease [Actinomyces sp.]|jgi:putative ABC transport system permease protein|nr:ABC transporter permease [Actinomyces sp.]